MLFSILIIFICGYFFKLFKTDYSKPLIDIVIYISFPALIIHKIYNLHYVDDIFNVFFLSFATLLAGMFFAIFIANLLKFERKTEASFLLVSTLGNTSFLGFPVIVSMFGDKHLIWAIFFDEITFIGLVTLGSLFVAYGSESKMSIKKIVIDILKFPPFPALLFALFLRNFEVNIDFLKPIGDSLIFLVILAIGMRFSFKDVKRNLKLASLVLIIKMVLVPFFIYFLITQFFSISEIPYQISFIESAMPPMVMASVLAIEAKLKEDLAISAVGLGILVSFAILPIYKYFLI